MPFFFTNDLSVAVSSELMPTMASWSAEASERSLMKWGISCTQGGHHVAQKSSTTRLPFNSLSLRGWPSRVVTEISGAATPSQSPKSADSVAGGAPRLAASMAFLNTLWNLGEV